MPLPRAMEIPVPTLAPPSIKPFEWEPVPIYVETVPPKPGSPTTSGAQEDVPNEPEDNSVEEDVKENQETAPNNNTEQPNIMTSGKPELPALPEEILAEVQTVEVPFIGVEVPVPRPEILVTATATAGISSVAAVGGTLAATTLFKQLQPLLKPVFKFALKKLAAIRKKPPPVTWSRLRLKESRRRRQKRMGYVGQF